MTSPLGLWSPCRSAISLRNLEGEGGKEEGAGRVPRPGSQSPDGLHPVLAPQPRGTWEQEAHCGRQGLAGGGGWPGRFQTAEAALESSPDKWGEPGTRTAASGRGCHPVCPPPLCGAPSKAGRAAGWAGRAQCLPLLPHSQVTRKAVGDQDRVVPPSGPHRPLKTITAFSIQFRRLSRPQCPRQPHFRSPRPQFRAPPNCLPSGPPLRSGCLCLELSSLC